MGSEKREINPVLFKFGLALAVSVAGFLYARLRYKRIPPPQPPPSSQRSERCSDVKAKSALKSSLQATPTICHKASNASDRYDGPLVPRVAIESPTVGLSPRCKSVGDEDGYLLPEFKDIVKDYDLSAKISPKKNVETPGLDAEMLKPFKSLEADCYEQEIMHLKNTVRALRERERNLEVQLLEYYGLKEQETAVLELQNRLKLNNMEAKLFSLKIDSLQTDNRRLETQVADYSRITGELDSAKAKIKILKKKLRFEAEHNKEQIIDLQKRVAKLLEEEQKNGLDDHNLQQKLNDLEMEVEELRKSNLKLQLENSELARKLESTQILATAVLKDHEAEELKEISSCLKQKNEDLAKEIERLQASRCADVEELVYLRWINACLRFELRNYQPPPGKTFARDLSKTLSPKSEEKAKQLILEYAKTEGGSDADAGVSIIDFDSDWSASLASYLTDSGEPDDSPRDSLSVNGTSSRKKLKLLKKLRNLIRSKDSRRHSKDLEAERTLLSDDVMKTYPSDSRRYSSRIDIEADEQSSKFTSPAWHLSRKSLDIPRQKYLSKEEMHELARIQRSQSNLASPDGPKRCSTNRKSVSEQQDEDLNVVSKAELIKYAEALKDTRVGPPNMYKINSFKSC